MASGAADRSIAPESPSLVRLFRANWRRLGLTYALFNAECLLWLAQPSAIGMAINGLLAGGHGGLAILVAQYLVWVGLSTARQLYDTRAFTAIYTDTAHRLVVQQRQAGVDVSTVAARSALSRELVDFFEHDLKGVFVSIYGVVGALVMLATYDVGVAGLCVLIVGPVALLSRRLGRRSLDLNGKLNDQLEREVEVVEEGCSEVVHDHYRRVARCRVRLSDLGAWNYCQMEFLVLGLIIAGLVRSCARAEFNAGDIYALLAYILAFAGGLGNVPAVVQQFARLRDITRRLGSGITN